MNINLTFINDIHHMNINVTATETWNKQFSNVCFEDTVRRSLEKLIKKFFFIRGKVVSG